MKKIRCGSVVPGCDVTVHGKSEADVLARAAEHARSAHGVTEISPALMAKMKGAITDDAGSSAN